METKKCSKCGEIKPVGEFNKSKSSKDGLFAWCKSCQKQYKKKYAEKNKDYFIEYGKKYYEKNKEQQKINLLHHQAKIHQDDNYNIYPLLV